MAFELAPFPLPDSADASKLGNFGRVVKGVNPADIIPGSDVFKDIESALYTVCFQESPVFQTNAILVRCTPLSRCETVAY